MLRRLLPAAFAQGPRTSDAIRDFGYAVTSQRGPITTDAYRRIRDWQQDWLALGAGIGLTLVAESITLGCSVALERLTEPRNHVPAPTQPRAHAGSPVLVGQS